MGSPILVVAVSFLFTLTIYRYLLHPILISPLRKVRPAHWSAPFCSLWILFTRRRRNENTTIYALHQRLGPLVRLGPHEISVNCVDGGIRTIYSGGYEKGDWYAVYKNYGVNNIFSSLEHGPHSVKKRILSNIYAKSTIQSSTALHDITEVLMCHRMLPRLHETQSTAVEAYELFSGVAMDVITGYCFGLSQSSNFLVDSEHCKRWVVDYKARQAYIFWPQELPGLTAFAKAWGLRHWLVPKWVDVANDNIASWVLSLCDKAERAHETRNLVDAKDQATVYNQMRSVIKKSKGDKADSPLTADERLDIASELLDQVLAGFDTTGITMTYLAWQMSKPENKHIQQALREELQASQAMYKSVTDDGQTHSCPEFRTLDSLPLLHAVDAELGPQGSSIKGIPANVRVNSYGYSLHLNEDVFPKPSKWEPRRWLNAQGEIDGGGEKARWFWAFGSGGRMCIGSHLAMIDMKSIVAAIWGNFETAIVDDAGMIPKGGYTCEPLGSPEVPERRWLTWLGN
ncbi:cytochrome p450 [Diaporthe amygdali]|uniref:cytochrome p450 n=1 Tax=Phomopsis amygdali TaxID=1214568 RepID=UPI0022FECF39|nr:cytochrome p450 [Diaporthe amygdali]KAJ0122365.1 cytochrome p450 [Diaporthe amygdali]